MKKLMMVGCFVAALSMGLAVQGAEAAQKAKPSEPAAAKAEKPKEMTKAEKRAARRAHEKLLDKHLGPLLDKKFKVVDKMEHTAEATYRNAKFEGVGEKEASNEARAMMSTIFAEAIPVLEAAVKDLRAVQVPAEIEADRVKQLAEAEKTLKWAKENQAKRASAEAQAETARLVKQAQERKVRVEAKKARKAKLKKELLQPALAPKIAAFNKISEVGDQAYNNAKAEGVPEKEADAEARAVVSKEFPALLPAVEETLKKLHAIENVEELKDDVAKDIKSAEQSLKYMQDQIKAVTDEQTAKDIATRRANAAKRKTVKKP